MVLEVGEMQQLGEEEEEELALRRKQMEPTPDLEESCLATNLYFRQYQF